MKLNNQQIEAAKKMQREGFTQSIIASYFKVSKNTLRNYLKNYDSKNKPN